MFQDRPYQTQAIEANLSDYDRGVRRMLNVMATGTGKTYVFSRLSDAFRSRLPGQTLVLAHTDELVHQNADKLREYNPHLRVSVEMGKEQCDTDSDIISGSIQSLGRVGTKRLDKLNRESIDKVVVDEAHHSTTDAYRRVLDWSGCLLDGSSKLLLGVTATPQRTDGVALEDTFEKISYVYSLRQAILDRWLVPIRGFRVYTDISIEGVALESISPLSRAVNTDERNKRVVHAWQKLGEGRKTVVYTVDIEHAEKVAQEFKDNGIAAEYVYGDDPARETKLAKHRAGEYPVVIVCGLLIEGYDDPDISCVVLARPTASPVFLAQAVGRGTRIAPGKKDCIVIDVVDATTNNSLVTLPTLMGLSKDLDVEGNSLLDVVETLEQMSADHPNVDFTKLKQFSKAGTLIKEVDLMEVRFPAEVEANSDLTWFRAIDGGFKMLIPNEGHGTGFVRVQENALGRWALIGQINEEEFHGSRPTMEEAFKVADEQIRKRVNKVSLQYILREATWHNKPVTKGQKLMLTRLYKGRPFPWDQMTSGQASKLISERLARLEKK